MKTSADKKKQQILRIVREKAGISRREIAGIMGMNLSGVGGLCRELLAEGLLIEEIASSSRTGRRAALLRPHPEAVYAVGIEVSSRAIRGVLQNLAGEVVAEKEGDQAVIGDREKMLAEIVAVAGYLAGAADGLPLSGIGVGIAGIVEKDRRRSLSFPHLESWREVDLGGLLEEKTGVEALVENQVHCTTLAELRYGQGRNLSNFLYLHIGWGIGLGVVIEGKVYAGATNNAGELGHIMVQEGGPICYCGNYGCLESLASPPAIEAQYAEAVGKGVDSTLAREIRNGGTRVSIEAIIGAARAGERLASNLLENAARHIGSQTANLVNLLNPEAVIIGGILADEGALFLEVIERTFRSRVLSVLQKEDRIRVSGLGKEACSRGAAALVFDELFAKPEKLLDRGFRRGKGGRVKKPREEKRER